VGALIVKLSATGDVMRTTPLLSRLNGQITWLTERKNEVLLEGLLSNLRCISWEDREKVLDRPYDLVINLDDSIDVAQLLKSVECNEILGAYARQAKIPESENVSGSDFWWLGLELRRRAIPVAAIDRD